METAIVCVGCCTDDPSNRFGMRVQSKATGAWGVTWTSPLSNSRKFDEPTGDVGIQGSIVIDTAKPICDFCGAKSFFKCGSCDGFNSWKENAYVTCGWCQAGGIFSGAISSFKSGDDL